MSFYFHFMTLLFYHLTRKTLLWLGSFHCCLSWFSQSNNWIRDVFDACNPAFLQISCRWRFLLQATRAHCASACSMLADNQRKFSFQCKLLHHFARFFQFEITFCHFSQEQNVCFGLAFLLLFFLMGSHSWKEKSPAWNQRNEHTSSLDQSSGLKD